MDDPTATLTETEKPAPEKQRREQSTVGFPYSDLNDAVALARAIWDNVGTSTCDQSQLAAWAGHDTVESGAFRTRMASARTYGLITTGSKQVALTALGRTVVDPDRAALGRVEAFLNVPLYSRLFDRYQGTTLPSTNVALEADFVDLGVAEKQKDRARQVFQRSAEQAGFFAQGRNRLVRPGVRQTEDQDDRRGGGGGGTDGESSAVQHPMVRLLVEALPPVGTVWGKGDRAKWVALANAAFDVVYKEDSSPSASRASAPAQPPERSHDDAQD